MQQITPYASRPADDTTASLQDRLFTTRNLTLKLASSLTAEDMTVQAMDDASPAKWHLAHVTWFFETFILTKHLPDYRPFDPKFHYCFNSYYESEGARHPRPNRGLLTRPALDAVLAYRKYVDEALLSLCTQGLGGEPEVARLVEMGIHHEQQHQELLLMDILALFAASPLKPAYTTSPAGIPAAQSHAVEWIEIAGGINRIGSTGDEFAWDNETPRHHALVQSFRLADRLVTNAEWTEFIDDGGYRNALLWLADGWSRVNREEWSAPNYWENLDGEWFAMSLAGLLPVDPAEPVVHVSYYEAEAFARWSGCRLPTEFEWEVASHLASQQGNFISTGRLRPAAAAGVRGRLDQMFGDVWEWTQSAYLPYPGYRPPAGAIGEYNGKFMVSQHVLRGGSCATPDGHVRPTYRNFFYPHQRWQFAGVRLASEIA